MRTLIGYATGLGIVIALAGMPLTAIGLAEGTGERIRSISVTEFFNPQIYLGGGLALPTWLTIAAVVVALILTANNSTSAERPKSAWVLITYLVAALTVCFPAVMLFGVARDRELVAKVEGE